MWGWCSPVCLEILDDRFVLIVAYSPMKYGDLVKALPPFALVGGYLYAVVMTVNPLVLVSEDGDMLWSTVEEENLIVVGQASPVTRSIARKRYDRDWKLNEI